MLSPQVHGPVRGPTTSIPKSSCSVGDVRDPDDGARARSAASTRSTTSPRWSASARACTRSADYTGVNNLGTAVLLEALIEQPVERLVVASSMSIYGEGLYCAPDGIGVGAGRATARAAAPRATGRCATRRRRARRRRRRRKRSRRRSSSVYALSKFDQERLCLMHRRGLRDPDGRAALLQRLRHAAGAVEPVHRRARDLRVAPAQRPAAADLRRRAAAARLRERPRRRARLPARARRRGRGGPASSTSAAASTSRSARWRRAWPRRSGRSDRAGDHRRVPRRRHPPLLRRHHAGAASVLGYEPQVTLDDGLVELAEWLEGQQADDRVGDGAAGTRSARADGMTRAARDARTPQRHGGRLALITGGAGFIGTNLADRLLRTAGRVLHLRQPVAPGRRAEPALAARARTATRVRVEVGDVRDARARAARRRRTPTQVFHFAAQVAVTTSLVDPVARLRGQRARHAQRARGDARRRRSAAARLHVHQQGLRRPRRRRARRRRHAATRRRTRRSRALRHRRGAAARLPQPLRLLEGRRRPVRARLRAHLRAAGGRCSA